MTKKKVESFESKRYNNVKLLSVLETNWKVTKSSLDFDIEANKDTVYVETCPSWNDCRNLRFLIVLIIFFRKKCWLFASVVFRFFSRYTEKGEKERERNDFCPMKFLRWNSKNNNDSLIYFFFSSLVVSFRRLRCAIWGDDWLFLFSCQYF